MFSIIYGPGLKDDLCYFSICALNTHATILIIARRRANWTLKASINSKQTGSPFKTSGNVNLQLHFRLK